MSGSCLIYMLAYFLLFTFGYCSLRAVGVFYFIKQKISRHQKKEIQGPISIFSPLGEQYRLTVSLPKHGLPFIIHWYSA